MKIKNKSMKCRHYWGHLYGYMMGDILVNLHQCELCDRVKIKKSYSDHTVLKYYEPPKHSGQLLTPYKTVRKYDNEM